MSAISMHKFSTKAEENSIWFDNNSTDRSKIRNVRGCVPNDTQQLVQKLTDNIDTHKDEIRKCEMNLAGIWCRE